MSEDPAFDVVGLGTVVVDHQLILNAYPAVNSKVEAIAEHIQVGGPVPTALVQLARWGKRTAFIGTWGLDPHGQLITADLDAEGLDLSRSIIHPDGRSGMAQVWVDQETGSRTIACQRGSHQIDAIPTPESKILHLDGWSQSAALAAARAAREVGATVVLDTGSPKPGLAELLPLVDIVICPAPFMLNYFHDENAIEGAQKLLDLGPGMVVHTHGEKGAEVYLPERQFHQPAFTVETVDTTGAGDVFCAGILYGTLEGWEAAPTVEFAAAAAAFKCRGLGNREALPERHEVEELLAKPS